MNRKVLYARFHQSIYAPGAGELGNTLPAGNKTLDNLSMLSTDHGLLAKFTTKGIKHEILIPSANVVLMTLSADEAGPIASVSVLKGA